ncbi:scavenger receptor cysteine-rich type 1 protein M130-like [Ptychodera flava]|uniref:scavenger receptor cysteine-rich type 1 protein M130-like n=1 Tax=Ptychodera flava TaxID=63121 RepID=UPI003969C1AF
MQIITGLQVKSSFDQDMETNWATLCAALVTVLLHSRVTDAESEVVRLVGGETPYEGRVEMFIEDEWLPVLYYRDSGSGVEKSWSFSAADILCNELGYKGSMSYGSSRALYGDPRRRITIIHCDENNESLLDCEFDLSDSFITAATVKCNSIDCGNPGEVENADRIGTQYSYNSTVIYTCHDGYYTNGSGTIRCTLEGRWTEKPSCFFNGSVVGISFGVVTVIVIG